MEQQSKRTLMHSWNKRKRGFTLIEVVVVLAITVIITGVIYSFYSYNSRTLTNAEAKSTLQMEGNQIQRELLNLGAQAKSIKLNVNGNISEADDVTKITFSVYDFEDSEDTNGVFNSEAKNYVFEVNSEDSGEPVKNGVRIHEMKIYPESADSNDYQPKSKHVKDISVKSLDGKPIDESGNVEITVNLYIKKGYSEINYPITTNIKLRNRYVTE